jgi:hypothetical protein
VDLKLDQFDATLKILDTEPFSLCKSDKEEIFKKALKELTQHHIDNCVEYGKVVKGLQSSMVWDLRRLESFPFIPVRLFKLLELKSINKNDVFKEMLSSGTSNQNPSRIFLDRFTAQKQSIVLSKLFKDFIGLNRPPILVIDSPETVKNRSSFSARTAGILGFSYLGRDLTFALRNDFSFNLDLVKDFLVRHQGETILIFGFTSIIWEYFLASSDLKDSGLKFPNSILLHGGGWKKLSQQSVNNDLFKGALDSKLGIRKVVNYYGLVEQTGSLFFECASGYLHSSNYSNVIVREPRSFESLNSGNVGMLQLQSALPFSYPGHSILTEDLGEIFGTDDCECGRFGQKFKVYGRIPEAETRGCSDTFER